VTCNEVGFVTGYGAGAAASANQAAYYNNYQQSGQQQVAAAAAAYGSNYGELCYYIPYKNKYW